MAKETFILRTEWFDAISKLKPSEQLIILHNLFLYHSDRQAEIKLPNLSTRLVWDFIEPNLRRNIEKYDGRRETSGDNGKKGGRPPKNRAVGADLPEVPVDEGRGENLNNLNKPNSEPNNLPENLSKPNNPIVSVSDTVSDSACVSSGERDPYESLEGFEIFWESYGKKSDRHKCEHEWFEMSVADRRRAVAAIPDYVRSLSNPRYLRTALNYLEGKVWEGVTNSPPTVRYVNTSNGAEGSMPLAQWAKSHENNSNTTLKRLQ